MIGEEVFKSTKPLIHFAANDFELEVYGVEPPVDCIKAPIDFIEPNIKVFSNYFDHILSVTQVVLWLSSNRVSGVDRPR